MASDKTIWQMVAVLERHLSQEQIKKIAYELWTEVEGNKSVMDTLAKLYVTVCRS